MIMIPSAESQADSQAHSKAESIYLKMARPYAPAQVAAGRLFYHNRRIVGLGAKEPLFLPGRVAAD